MSSVSVKTLVLICAMFALASSAFAQTTNATIVGNVADEPTRKAAHQFLESNTVQVWVNAQLDGR